MEKLPKSQKEYYHNESKKYKEEIMIGVNSKHFFYDTEIKSAAYNLEAAIDLMMNHNCFIYNEDMVDEDPKSNGTNWLKFAYVKHYGKIMKLYYETGYWGSEIKEIPVELYKDKVWKAAKFTPRNIPMSVQFDPGEDYLPYAVENKHIGSDFDSFLKTNNIELKRDINWAVKMLDAGKMMTREGNRSLTLFPKKYDHAESTITTDDLFAEDWMVVQSKTFKDVLDDLYAGKTIRRKSWHPDFGVGKYAANYGKLIYLDLIADDWEVIDVIAEVNKQQEQILKDRNEH